MPVTDTGKPCAPTRNGFPRIKPEVLVVGCGDFATHLVNDPEVHGLTHQALAPHADQNLKNSKILAIAAGRLKHPATRKLPVSPINGAVNHPVC